MPLLGEVVRQIEAFLSLRLLSLEQLYDFLRVASCLRSEIELSHPRSRSTQRLLPSNVTNFLAETICVSEAQVVDLWAVCSYIVLDLNVRWEWPIDNLVRSNELREWLHFIIYSATNLKFYVEHCNRLHHPPGFVYAPAASPMGPF